MAKIVEVLCDWKLENVVLRQQISNFLVSALLHLKIAEDLKEISVGYPYLYLLY